ncbi:hypothetical protein [Mycolicibacter minnesotensis]
MSTRRAVAATSLAARGDTQRVLGSRMSGSWRQSAGVRWNRSIVPLVWGR